MDLSDVLNATKPVVAELSGFTLTAEAYLLGRDRLTKEQRATLSQCAKEDGEEKKIDVIDFARAFLPLAASTLQVKPPGGEECAPSPITEESVIKLPDAVLLTIANKVREDLWANPTSGAQSPDTSESSEAVETVAA